MQTWCKRFLVEHKHGVNWVQTSTLARQGLLGMVRGSAHGPRVDVVQLAACAHHASHASSCERSVPSSRYCTGVYLPNCPWFFCFSTHCSAGKQARQTHPLTGAIRVLQIQCIMQAQSRYMPSNHDPQWFADGHKSLHNISLIAEKFS